MYINKLSLDLVVNDVDASVDFYINILGFTKIEGDSHFAILKAVSSEIMLMSKSDFDQEVPNNNRPQNQGWFVLIVEVPNIKEVYEKIKNKVKIIRELQSTDYGTQEFLLTDLDGYYIQFTQRN